MPGGHFFTTMSDLWRVYACVVLLCSTLVVASVAAPVGATTPALVTIDWTNALRTLTTSPGFQTVVNALTTRAAPQHDAVYRAIEQVL